MNDWNKEMLRETANERPGFQEVLQARSAVLTMVAKGTRQDEFLETGCRALSETGMPGTLARAALALVLDMGPDAMAFDCDPTRQNTGEFKSECGSLEFEVPGLGVTVDGYFKNIERPSRDEELGREFIVGRVVFFRGDEYAEGLDDGVLVICCGKLWESPFRTGTISSPYARNEMEIGVPLPTVFTAGIEINGERHAGRMKGNPYPYRQAWAIA